MKTTILFLLLAMCAQAQTTQEEFNYCSKGYKIQVESGLDMKKGYTLGGTNLNTFGQTKAQYVELFRNGDNKPCAWIIIVSSPDYPTSNNYLCLPHTDSSKEIWEQYWTQYKNLSPDREKAVSWMLAKLASRNGAY